MKKKSLIFLLILIFLSFLFFKFNHKIIKSDELIGTDIQEFHYDENDDKLILKDTSKDKIKPERINSNNELLFVMMGVDSPTVAQSKGTRTDTIMLSKVNFDTGAIDILSIPRDTRVDLRGKKDKINHAHAFGGPELTIKAIEDFIDIDLEYYIKVDYRAVMAVVDAIGGVDVDVPMDMKYDDPADNPPLHIDIKKGPQTLNGQQAHDFLRFRKGYKEGDLGRVKTQQYFMEQLIKQVLNPKNIFKLPSLIKTYYDYVETNIPLSIILKGATSANKLDLENINMQIIPGEGKYINKLSYYVYDEEKTEELVNQMFRDYKKRSYY